MAIHDDKPTVQVEEEVYENAPAEKLDDVHAQHSMPESLRGMSEGEIAALEKSIVRKIDMVVLPIIVILYILNYIDRQNLAAAKLRGILPDLNMNTTQFATAIAILYAGYLPFQVPSNYIISKITRPGLYICLAVIAWGSVSAATGAVQSYGALLAVRVLLGATEAVFFPGALYYLSAWYTKSELGKRYAVLFIGQQIGNGFGGLIAAGILNGMQGTAGLAAWRWLFIIEGALTVFLGAIFAVLMPEYPHNARILSQPQRDLAVWRLEQEAGAGEAHEEVSNLKAFVSALRDPKVITLICCMLCSQAMGSVGNFFPTILSSLGYNPTVTLLLTAPPYVFACFVFYGISYFSDKHGKLYWPQIFCLSVGMIIYAIAVGTTNTGARYFAMMWTPVANVVPQLFIYNTLSLHCPRPYPKRAAGLALINAIGGTSNTWSSYLWANPPHFYPGFGMVLAVTVTYATIITCYKFYVNRENRKLDQGGDSAKHAMRHGITQEQLDLGWRYVGY